MKDVQNSAEALGLYATKRVRNNPLSQEGGAILKVAERVHSIEPWEILELIEVATYQVMRPSANRDEQIARIFEEATRRNKDDHS